MSSQIELIKSRDTLLAVIDQRKPALRTRIQWHRPESPLAALMHLIGRSAEPKSLDETVLQNLNDRLTVIRERDSAVISIFVRSSDPAARRRHRQCHRRRACQAPRRPVAVRHRRGLGLAGAADRQAPRQGQEAETKVANFKVDNDLFAGTNNTSLLDQQLSDIATQITAAQERKNTAQPRAALIRGLLKAGQPIDGVADVRNSVTSSS